MPTVLTFDVCGTLIDTHGVDRHLIASDKLIAIIAVGLEPGQCVNDRLGGAVVGAERQGL